MSIVIAREVRTIALGAARSETFDGAQKRQVRYIDVAGGGDVLVANLGKLVVGRYELVRQ